MAPERQCMCLDGSCKEKARTAEKHAVNGSSASEKKGTESRYGSRRVQQKNTSHEDVIAKDERRLLQWCNMVDRSLRLNGWRR